MSGAFQGGEWIKNSFNQPLDNWDLSSVTDMSWMFFNAEAFNQNLCQWKAYINQKVDYHNIFQGTACPQSAFHAEWGVTATFGFPMCQACNN